MTWLAGSRYPQQYNHSLFNTDTANRLNYWVLEAAQMQAVSKITCEQREPDSGSNWRDHRHTENNLPSCPSLSGSALLITYCLTSSSLLRLKSFLILDALFGPSLLGCVLSVRPGISLSPMSYKTTTRKWTEGRRVVVIVVAAFNSNEGTSYSAALMIQYFE